MYKFVVPIEPKPQSRPKFKRMGKNVMTYELKDMTDYKNSVANTCKKQFNGETLCDAKLNVSMTFYITPPKYVSKVKKNATRIENEVIRVNKKPDLDNYVKAILDALNGVVYKDDGMVTELHAKKFYSDKARVEITIVEES